MGEEIERKFLIAEVPAGVGRGQAEPIRQGYLAVTADGTEVRVRQRGERYYLTVKHGRGLVRGETEIALTREQFDALWPAAGSSVVEKTREEIPLGEHVVEVDIFGGDLAGLALAEVEFSSVESSHAFNPPAWFGREVTEDDRYKNRRLADEGPPEDTS